MKELVPKNFHLFDRVDMKEYQLKHKTNWWKRMSEPPKGVGVFLCKPIQTFSLGLKMGGLYVEVRFLRLGETSIIIILKYTSNDSIQTLVNPLFS